MRSAVPLLIVWSILLVLVTSWSKEDQEIFRLRDEVEASEGEDFVGVKPSASQDDINKAYKKKSRLIHPDKVKQSVIAAKPKATPKSKPGQKSSKPGVRVSKPPSESEIRDAVKKASDRFARLGVIAVILRGPGRERYDHFLNNGFPTWKGTGYYYARFRPGLGSVLLGLFVLGGGLAHYGAMYISWKRQRDFVDRYIRFARRTAWGDESGIRGIPGLDGPASAPPSATSSGVSENGYALNRRQKRMQEKESRKEKEGKKPKGNRRNGDSTPAAPLVDTETADGPQGERKKVQAENGKILIVDSLGNVYLEEENEDGEKGEYLLDPAEIPRPTIGQTVLFRLPVWIYRTIKDRTLGRPALLKAEDGEGEEVQDVSTSTDEDDKTSTKTKLASNGSAHKRGKKRGKGQ